MEFGDHAGHRLLRQALRALGAEVIRIDGIDSAETPMSRAQDAYLHRSKRRVGLDRESKPDRQKRGFACTVHLMYKKPCCITG
ncbi:MAG: hypothetical protein V3U43_10085, partial [Pseudomonadales bacterium]